MHRISLIRSINTNENEHGRGRYMVEASGVYRLGNRVKVEIEGGPKGKVIASVLPLE